LRGHNHRLAVFNYHPLQPDVIVENEVLQVEPVEVFGRGGSVRVRTKGDALAFLLSQLRGLEHAVGLFIQPDNMLASAHVVLGQASA
jgi:hypothetical protein